MRRAGWQGLAVMLAAASLFASAAPIRPNESDTRPPTHSGDQQSATTKPRPRLFKAQDLGLLESPDRVEWQKPEQIMDTLRIAESSVVADLGAGSGWFTIQLARRVGPNGIVYAEDIQPQMVDYIEQRAQRENLRAVRPILGTVTDPLLPPGVDAILI